MRYSIFRQHIKPFVLQSGETKNQIHKTAYKHLIRQLSVCTFLRSVFPAFIDDKWMEMSNSAFKLLLYLHKILMLQKTKDFCFER